MIATVRGTLTHKSPTEITVDVHGVGYALHIPLSTFEKLGELNTEVTLLTYLHVKEDALLLYGFATEQERGLFKLLISVSGIGPRMAQGILSGISTADLRVHLTQGNLGALTAIPGVGRKLAERLVVELREKLSKVDLAPAAVGMPGDPHGKMRAEALFALSSLGYSRPLAEKAVHAALLEMNGKPMSLETLIKSALRQASK